MAIQTIPGGLWLPSSAPFNVALPGFASIGTLTSVGSQLAWIFQVPKSGTLDWFEVRQLANTNTPDNGVRFIFEGVDALGKPDNVEDQYSIVTTGFAANAWLVPPSYMGATGPGSGAKRVVTRNEWLACVIRLENWVTGDSISISGLDMPSRASPNFMLNAYMGSTSNSGTTWATLAVGGISIALKYDDGSYATLDHPNIPASLLTLRTFSAGTNPDERGLLFQVPFPGRLSGVWIRADTDDALDVVLYNAANTAVVTETIANNNRYAATGANAYYLFTTPYTLTKNVDYRLIVKPGASTVGIYDMDFNSSAIRAANPGGSTWMSTNRNNAGAWTNVATNLPLMGLVFDGFDDATGGGGGGEHSSVF